MTRPHRRVYSMSSSSRWSQKWRSVSGYYHAEVMFHGKEGLLHTTPEALQRLASGRMMLHWGP